VDDLQRAEEVVGEVLRDRHAAEQLVEVADVLDIVRAQVLKDDDDELLDDELLVEVMLALQLRYNF